MYLKEAIVDSILDTIITNLEKLYSKKFMKVIAPEALKQLKSARKNLEEARKILKKREDKT